MRSLTLTCGIVLVFAAARPTAASQSAEAAVTVTATFSARTSLDVSTQMLQFDAVEPGRRATAVVDFAAKSRTTPGGDVVLSIEPLGEVTGPGVAADITFEGEGEGTMGGRMIGARPAIAGRWTGSGRRSGRLVFAIRARETGTYRVPVRFVLSAP